MGSRIGTLKRVQLRETSHFSGAGEQHQLVPGIVLEREELQRMPQTRSQVILQSLHRKVSKYTANVIPFPEIDQCKSFRISGVPLL